MVNLDGRNLVAGRRNFRQRRKTTANQETRRSHLVPVENLQYQSVVTRSRNVGITTDKTSPIALARTSRLAWMRTWSSVWANSCIRTFSTPRLSEAIVFVGFSSGSGQSKIATPNPLQAQEQQGHQEQPWGVPQRGLLDFKG